MGAIVSDNETFAEYVEEKFSGLDKHNSGRLSPQELRQAVATIGIALGLPSPSSRPHLQPDMWRQMVALPSMDDLVKKPDLLSFYIASKIPVPDATRQELLEIDGVAYRLQREIQLLECIDRICCKNCLTLIARRSNMLVMSTDGPIGAYVNPHGFVHETLTLYKTKGLALRGDAETEHSWFPGYAWTIAHCSVCDSHMGWLFTAVKEGLHPKSFWGVRRSQLILAFSAQSLC